MSELIEIVNYYKVNIKPYTYKIMSDNNLLLEFQINEDNLCHLLFGTIQKGMKNRGNYMGNLGYKNLELETVTKENLPNEIKKHANERTDWFPNIHKLLDNPKAGYFFNKEIVEIGKAIRLNKTDIQGDFLIYKEVDGYYLHLILKNISQNGTVVPIPCCFFVRKVSKDRAEMFIEKQKEFRIVKCVKK